MWAFIWLLQGLVASASGVYLNSPCIRALLKCAPFQLSLSDGKFSNTFIQDASTLNRQCRSIGPLLECLQEAVLRQCSSSISPAEEEFVKTRLFVAEICKDVDYTQKAYLRNAACINRERDEVIQACNPYDYVQLVNTSNLISLEGSCLFQKMLINCRQDAIHDKCGPDAADLYQRVKAVDMNVDFLCLEGRNLRSPKFMLDVVINSYISLLLETLRPVLVMESLYLRNIVEVRQEEITPTPTTNARIKRAKMPAPFVQDSTEYKWRRFGDIPMETITESSSDDESSIDSVDEEYFPLPIVVTDPVSTTSTDPAGDLEAVAMDTANIEAGADSGLAAVEDASSNSDGIIETTGLDLDGLLSTESSDVEEEASSDPDSAGSEFEQASLNSESSNTKVVLGIHIPQFDHTEDTTLDTNDVSDASGADLGTIQVTTMHEPSDLETTTDSDEFQGMATLCPEYLETTVGDDVDDDSTTTAEYPGDHETSADLGTVQNAALHSGDQEASSANLDDVQETTMYPDNLETTVADDVDDARETTTQYPGDHETSADLGTVQTAALHSGAQEAPVANLDDVQETTTMYYTDNLETTADDLDSLQKTTHFLYSSDDFKDTSAESGSLIEETRAKFVTNEEQVFDTSLPPETKRANFGEESGNSSPQSIISHLKRVDDFVSNTEYDHVKLKEFFEDLAEISKSEEFASQEYMRNKMAKDVAWVMYFFSINAKPEASVVEEHTSNAKDPESATTEDGSVENLEGGGRIEGNFEKELDGYVTSTVVSGVLHLLSTLFAPKEIERRSVSLPPHFIKSMSPEEVEALIHKNLPGGEFVKELVKSWDQTVDAESERLKNSAGHKDVKTPEDPVAPLTTIKSIAELGVKLNYVLIGESYVPLEVGYVEGDKERISNHNLKIQRRKFKFYTSTPTEPSNEIPEDLGFSTTEYLPETSTEEPESFSKSDSTGNFPSDFSCPEATGNLTPRISHLVDPETRSRMEDCFSVLREETQLAGESTEDDLSNENPSGETNPEFRRSGDMKELLEKVDPRNIDMETMVALKFYGEVLTELVSMLPPEGQGSKTLAKRASALLDVYGNYLKAKMDPSGIITRMDKFRSGRRFQKRSLSVSAECADQEKPIDGKCHKFKTDDGVRFDIGYSPESYIRLEMSYPAANRKEDAYDVPEAKYILMGETRLPLEIHFTHKNVNYAHYAHINIPKRSVDLKDFIALDEF